jgi:peptidoglycan biosynthesis protein MviN/MurJ (putative lipid II flippase)
MLAIAVPGAIAGGALQVNSLVTQMLSGSDEGARSVLYNSDRLYQLPLGLIGVAVGLALVPRLTRHFAENDQAGADRTMDDGIGLSMAFTLPAAIALLIMPFFIIDATVTRGAFTSADAHRTAEVLRQFAWGVPAFVLLKVFTPPFFARQKTKVPMQFSLVSVVTTVASVRPCGSGCRPSVSMVRSASASRPAPRPGSTSSCLRVRWRVTELTRWAVACGRACSGLASPRSRWARLSASAPGSIRCSRGCCCTRKSRCWS